MILSERKQVGMASDFEIFQLNMENARIAVRKGDLPQLRSVLRSRKMTSIIQEDPQSSLWTLALHARQPEIFHFLMAKGPPRNAVAVMSWAIRSQSFWAVEGLLPHIDGNGWSRLLEESVITQQQNFFNALYARVCDLAEQPIIVQDSLKMLYFSAYKHTHDVVQLFSQWQQEWHNEQQNQRITQHLPSTVLSSGLRKL